MDEHDAAQVVGAGRVITALGTEVQHLAVSTVP